MRRRPDRACRASGPDSREAAETGHVRGSRRVQRRFITSAITYRTSRFVFARIAIGDGNNDTGRMDMSSSRLALTAATMLLSMGFLILPQGPASAAKFCAQL